MREIALWIINNLVIPVIAMIIFLVLIIAFVNPMESDYRSFTNIESLERWQEVSWSFVLWFWWVNTETVYYAYKINWLHSYELVNIPLWHRNYKLSIVESDDEWPKFLKEQKCARKSILWFEKDIFWRYLTRCKIKRSIIVPRWTIQKTFNW